MLVALVALTSSCYRGADADAPQATDPDGAAEGDDGDETAGGSGDPDDDSLISECRMPTYEVYLRLAPSCIGCHDEGASVPLVADLVSFEQLVAYAPDLVVPGDPDNSRLLAMLRGEAPPPLRQMPVGTLSFVDLEEQGLTEIGMNELAEWIEKLEPCDTPGPSGSPRFATRVSVEQIQAMLSEQLDLTLADVEHTSRFPLDDPTFPELGEGHNSRREAHARWQSLGGPDNLRGDVRSSDWNPLFIQTIGPMAQAWCSRSIGLDRDALFRHAGPDSDSAVEADAIRANIEYLYLRMLGVVASADDVEAMYEGVYRFYEAEADSRTAWTAVCAALIRDPLWLSY